MTDQKEDVIDLIQGDTVLRLPKKNLKSAVANPSDLPPTLTVTMVDGSTHTVSFLRCNIDALVGAGIFVEVIFPDGTYWKDISFDQIQECICAFEKDSGNAQIICALRIGTDPISVATRTILWTQNAHDFLWLLDLKVAYKMGIPNGANVVVPKSPG